MHFSRRPFLTLTNNVDSDEMRILRHFVWVFIVCKRRQLVRLPKLFLGTSEYNGISLVLASLAVSRHYSKRRQLKWVCSPVCRNIYVPERPPVCTLWAQSSYRLFHFLNFAYYIRCVLGSHVTWCTCEISNVLLASGQVVYLHNHHFS